MIKSSRGTTVFLERRSKCEGNRARRKKKTRLIGRGRGDYETELTTKIIAVHADRKTFARARERGKETAPRRATLASVDGAIPRPARKAAACLRKSRVAHPYTLLIFRPPEIPRLERHGSRIDLRFTRRLARYKVCICAPRSRRK